MAYSTIPKGSLYMNTILYSGTGGTQVLTGVGFESTFNWIKRRDNAAEFRMIDQVRGGNYSIGSGTNDPQLTQTNAISAWSSDGFTVGATSTNPSGSTFVAWNWKGNGQGSSNTSGTINTTYTSANTTSGFSVSSYTGTGANATIGHGLGVTPKMIIIKNLSSYTNWMVYHQNLGNTKYLSLDTTAAEDTLAVWNNTTPTSSVFSVGTDQRVNANGASYIAYIFAEKQGYSKFGSYTGNNNADGTFVYTGFKPAFLMVKVTNTTGNWVIFDNRRAGYNDKAGFFNANVAAAEVENNADYKLDLLSNGFKFRGNSGDINGADSYLYMCFAENPFVATSGTSAIPVTAR